MFSHRWLRSLLYLLPLDRSFLISPDHPGALLKQGSSVFIQLQHGSSTQKERFRLLSL
jgi:hypothetical protein